MSQSVYPSFSRKDQVIGQIEALVCTILEGLDCGQPIAISLRTTESSQAQNIQPNLHIHCFPGNTYWSEWRFAVALRILDIIHGALVDGKIVSKRDVYYQDPDLFESQAVVDKYLDRIALNFHVSVRDLNVIAEVKGLLVGPVMIGMEEDSNNKVYNNSKGTLVPTVDEFANLLIPSSNRPRFLLLVEKKATFHTLASSNFHIRHDCVLLTGQGYPDLATRAFLYYFSNILAADIPCYALVDFDPDGLCIYSVYTRGSQALSHEINVTVPNLRLLGLKVEDAMHLLGKGITTTAADQENTIKLQYLSQRERQRAKGLLKRLIAEVKSVEIEEARQDYTIQRWDWRETDTQVSTKSAEALIREIQVCLMMGYKVETQILDGRERGLERWILEKIKE